MKRTLLFLFCLLIPALAFGQGANLSGAYGFTTWRINNHPVASQYNYRIDSVGAAIPSAFTFPVSVCNNTLSLPGNNTRSIANIGTGDTVKISDNGSSANNETVALNSVTVSGGNCALSLANSNSHFSYILSSGTCGLKPGLNDIGSKGTIEVTQEFYDAGCSASTITGLAGGAVGNFIHDISNGKEDWYGWNGTAFVKLSSFTPAGVIATTFGGLGIQSSASLGGSPVTLTSAQCGEAFALDAATGVVYILPATQPPVGCTYDFYVTTSVTSNSHEIESGSASHFLQGTPTYVVGAGGNAAAFYCNGSSHIAFKTNGTTTGGLQGSHIKVTVISSTVAVLDGLNSGSGTLATACSTTN